MLKVTKIAMYEFWYDYVKPKYNEKAKPKIRRYLRRYC